MYIVQVKYVTTQQETSAMINYD